MFSSAMDSSFLLAISQPWEGNRPSGKNWALISEGQFPETESLLLKHGRFLSKNYHAGKDLGQTKAPVIPSKTVSWTLTGSSHLPRQRQETGGSFRAKPARSAVRPASTGAWQSAKHRKSIRFRAPCLIAFYRQLNGICWMNPACGDKWADRRVSVGCLACSEMAF